MSGTNYDKICFITLKQAIDLRYPVVISTCDYPVGNAWDIVEPAAVAHICHGRLALMLRKFPEASGAFRKALLIQPNLAIGCLGLGMTEAWQNRLAAAMSDYRQVTRLAPKADIGWIKRV
jgi:hypothetical protein